MVLIGISGLIGSGKGAVADILVDQYGFTKMSFADSLKDATSAIFGWPRHLLEGDTVESREFRETVDPLWTSNMKDRWSEVTPRLILQKIGTEAMRDGIHQDIWIHSLHKKLMESKFQNFVIPDVRFHNEFSFIRKMGGFNVRVKKGKDPSWFYTACMQNSLGRTNQWDMNRDFSDVHVSEWASVGEKVDIVIENDGTLEDLPGKLEKKFADIGSILQKKGIDYLHLL